MTTIPIVQVFLNELGKVEVFWDFDKTNYFKFFNLYGSTSSDMSTPILIKGSILNAPDTMYDKNKIFVRFDRSVISSTGSTFYVKLRGVRSSDDVEESFDPLVSSTIIPSPSEKVPYYNVSMMYAYTGGNWMPYSG